MWGWWITQDFPVYDNIKWLKGRNVTWRQHFESLDSRLSCVFPDSWSTLTKCCVRVANKALSSNKQSIGLESKSGNTRCRAQTAWLISSERRGDTSKINLRGKDPVKVNNNLMEIFLFWVNLWETEEIEKNEKILLIWF